MLLLILLLLCSFAMCLLLDELHILFSVLWHSLWLLRNWTHLIKGYLCFCFRLFILDIWFFVFNLILNISTFFNDSMLFKIIICLLIRFDWVHLLEIGLWRFFYKVNLIHWIVAERINPRLSWQWWLLCIFNLHWFHLDDLVVHLIQDFRSDNTILTLWINLRTQNILCILFILLLHQNLLWIRPSFILRLRIELNLFLHLRLTGEILWIRRGLYLTRWFVFSYNEVLLWAWNLPLWSLCPIQISLGLFNSFIYSIRLIKMLFNAATIIHCAFLSFSNFLITGLLKSLRIFHINLPNALWIFLYLIILHRITLICLSNTMVRLCILHPSLYLLWIFFILIFCTFVLKFKIFILCNCA